MFVEIATKPDVTWHEATA